MNISRRRFLHAGLLAGSAATLTGCERLLSTAGQHLGQSVPATIKVPANADIDQDFHFLSRTSYGQWPGDLEQLKEIGISEWLEQQLHPENIDDKACDLRARRFETLHIDPSFAYEFKKESLRSDLLRHTVLRAIYSRRQLLEVMTGFWSDHLNIYAEKGDCIYLKTADDRDVVRRHALGNFKELIRASVTSPAMLVYLDGKENKRGKPSDVPNENYARELLELHTLGVHGGYTQTDVYEVARCLTGWRLDKRGRVSFDESLHDRGDKTVLGETVTAGGAAQVDRVVDIVCRHPSTARHIAYKLARHFVADEPPKQLIQAVAATFSASGGDIRSLLKCILFSEQFAQSPAQKLKRPFHFLVSCLRSTAADTHAHAELLQYLSRMGQAPFQHPTPDGYPDRIDPWVGTLLWRWNFAFALCSDAMAGTVCGVTPLIAAVGGAPHLFAYLIGRLPTAAEKQALAPLKDDRQLLGTILASPAFQRC